MVFLKSRLCATRLGNRVPFSLSHKSILELFYRLSRSSTTKRFTQLVNLANLSSKETRLRTRHNVGIMTITYEYEQLSYIGYFEIIQQLFDSFYLSILLESLQSLSGWLLTRNETDESISPLSLNASKARF